MSSSSPASLACFPTLHLPQMPTIALLVSGGSDCCCCLCRELTLSGAACLLDCSCSSSCGDASPTRVEGFCEPAALALVRVVKNCNSLREVCDASVSASGGSEMRKCRGGCGDLRLWFKLQRKHYTAMYTGTYCSMRCIAGCTLQVGGLHALQGGGNRLVKNVRHHKTGVWRSHSLANINDHPSEVRLILYQVSGACVKGLNHIHAHG